MKKLLKRALLTAIALAVAFAFAALPSGAAEDYVNVFQDYYKSNTSVETVNWDGKTKMKAGNVYLVSSSLSLSSVTKIPFGAALFVPSGVTLSINGGALYNEGHFAVEYGGTVDLREGKIVLNSGSKTGVGGSLYVGANTELKNYADIYVYSSGFILLSGKMTGYKGSMAHTAGPIVRFGDSTAISTYSYEQMPAPALSPTSPSFYISTGDYIRFYNYQNNKTYKVTAQTKLSALVKGINSVKLYPSREAIAPAAKAAEKSYKVVVYNSAGKAKYTLTPPTAVASEGRVIIDNMAYTFNENSMNYEMLYYYIIGVIAD
ncbi:MAG: hypothetical protein LBN40_06205 [Oscillospiraceae bacterium]|nr:hypothetical protein [Oscillospiraceae bacterium]